MGVQGAVHTKYAHYGRSQNSVKIILARLVEHQNCEKTVVSAAYDDFLGLSPPPNLQKIGSKLVHAAARTATCSIYDPKMVPK